MLVSVRAAISWGKVSSKTCILKKINKTYLAEPPTNFSFIHLGSGKWPAKQLMNSQILKGQANWLHILHSITGPPATSPRSFGGKRPPIPMNYLEMSRGRFEKSSKRRVGKKNDLLPRKPTNVP